VPERIKSGAFRARRRELAGTQPTGVGSAVTPPAIRGTRDAPPPPLAEPAHAYPPFGIAPAATLPIVAWSR